MQNELIALLTDIRDDKIKHDITLYEGASAQEIADFEERMGITLPEDLKTFHSFCNGFYSAEDMFQIIPLSETLDSMSKGYYPNLRNGQFQIAEYMIYCDAWTIQISDSMHEHKTTYTIDDARVNIVQFLKVFLAGGVFEGLYEWREHGYQWNEDYEKHIETKLAELKQWAKDNPKYFEELRAPDFSNLEEGLQKWYMHHEHNTVNQPAKPKNVLERFFDAIFKH